MIRLITLQGEMSGSARVNMTSTGTEIKLALRGNGHYSKNADDDITAFVTDGRRVKRVTLKNNVGIIRADNNGNTADRIDVRGIVITNGIGNFIAEGVSGLDSSQLTEIKASIRMMNMNSRPILGSHSSAHEAVKLEPQRGRQSVNSTIAKKEVETCTTAEDSRTDSDKINTDTGAVTISRKTIRACSERNVATRTQNKVDNSINQTKEGIPNRDSIFHGHSPITSEILDRANYLFHGENGARNDGVAFEIDPENLASVDEEAVKNPFPQMFPNSYWKRKIGDKTSMSGTANVKGIRYRVRALKSTAKYPPKELGRNVRKLRSTEGTWFWVGISRIR